MLTENEKEQALERARDCGWDYTHEVQRDGTDTYKYVTKGGCIIAYVDNGCRASVYDDRIGHTLYSKEFDEKYFFRALAKTAKCADTIADSYESIEREMAGL